MIISKAMIRWGDLRNRVEAWNSGVFEEAKTRSTFC